MFCWNNPFHCQYRSPPRAVSVKWTFDFFSVIRHFTFIHHPISVFTFLVRFSRSAVCMISLIFIHIPFYDPLRICMNLFVGRDSGQCSVDNVCASIYENWTVCANFFVDEIHCCVRTISSSARVIFEAGAQSMKYLFFVLESVLYIFLRKPFILYLVFIYMLDYLEWFNIDS